MYIIEVGEDMNIVDIVIILLILSMGLTGLRRGVIKQLVTTVGFIIVVILLKRVGKSHKLIVDNTKKYIDSNTMVVSLLYDNLINTNIK